MRYKLLQLGVAACFFSGFAFGGDDIARCEAAAGYRDRATSLYAQGQLTPAISQLKQAVQACPGQPFYKFMIANAHYRAGDLKTAAVEYEEFLAASPNHLEARMCLGFTRFELGEQVRALDHWAAAVQQDPNSPFARAALAVGLYATGDRDNAEIQYRIAVSFDARYADVDSLAIDIRWKPEVRAILSAIVNREVVIRFNPAATTEDSRCLTQSKGTYDIRQFISTTGFTADRELRTLNGVEHSRSL